MSATGEPPRKPIVTPADVPPGNVLCYVCEGLRVDRTGGECWGCAGDGYHVPSPKKKE